MDFEDWLYLSQCKATLIRLENKMFNLFGLTLVTILGFLFLLGNSQFCLAFISGCIFIFIQFYRFWTSIRIKHIRKELIKLEED